MLIVMLIAACTRKQDRAAPAPVETTKPSGAGPKRGGPIDVHGIAVRFLEDGTVEIAGTDRWGNGIDTKFENVDYFRGSIPVLERSVTAEQAAGLRRVAGP